MYVIKYKANKGIAVVVVVVIGAMRSSIKFPKFIERTFSSSLSFLDPYVNGILCLQRL